MKAEPMPSVVVGVDGSQASILALRWAGVIAPLMNAEIRAVTAWDFDVPFPLMAPALPNPDRAAGRTCSLAVERAFGTTAPAPVNQVIRRGSPAKVLIDESLTAQLLILGSGDHGHMKELLMGSVSTLAAQQAKCPVLIARGVELPPALMPAAAPAPGNPPLRRRAVNDSRTVVVGYDGSVEAAQAVRWAARQASARHCRLLLVHCSLWPLLTHNLGPVPGVADSGLERSAEITLEEGLSHARHVEPELDIETELVYGWPAEHLVKISAGKDLLVVGSRGIGGFMGLLIGSVSLEMAATAACPVAVIRSDDHPKGPVVVAVDRTGSPTALEDACTIATTSQSSLIIIHVRHTPAGYRQLRDPVDAEAAAEEVVNTAIETARALTPAIAVEGRVVTDTSIPRAILNAAKSAGIIVVGTKGQGLIRGTIGSTAHAVLHHAHGPVLISRRSITRGSLSEADNL